MEGQVTSSAVDVAGLSASPWTGSPHIHRADTPPARSHSEGCEGRVQVNRTAVIGRKGKANLLYSLGLSPTFAHRQAPLTGIGVGLSRFSAGESGGSVLSGRGDPTQSSEASRLGWGGSWPPTSQRWELSSMSHPTENCRTRMTP